MEIHQISVNYVAEADRLLLRVRTRDEALFSLWLTRRLMLRLWPRLGDASAALTLAGAGPAGATLVPEAREMLVHGAREETLKSTDFATPFEPRARVEPLGPEPLLPTEVRLQPLPDRRLQVVAREAAGRQVQMQLGEPLLVALLALIEKALRLADWGVALEPPAAAAAPVERVLN